MRVLIIKLGALGDVVMATALVQAIQRAHPNDELWLLTTPHYEPLFAPWPGLATIAFPRTGWRGTVARLRWVRAQHFDRVYDLQGNDRTGVLCALSGIPERVGNHTRYPYTHHPAERWRGQCHIFERMNAVLASAGVPAAAPRPVLPAGEADRAAVAEFVAAHGLAARRFALLHAGASALRQDKVWPHFGELGTRLEKHGVRAVWLGASGDRVRNAQLAAGGGIDATDAFTIVQLAEIARHARFAVTNDSGPMHVISAAEIPLFGLFGPSNWRRNHALGQAHRVLACVDYDPAFKGQLAGDCLGRIPVAAVWSRLEQEGLV